MATKNKTKKTSKLRRLVRVFDPKSLKGGVLLFALVFAIGGGGYYVYKSFAASAEASYYDNSPGIGHQVGKLDYINFTYGGGFYDNRRMWNVTTGVAANFMWYGPYTTVSILNTGGGIRACWYYQTNAADPNHLARMTLDVVYNNGKGVTPLYPAETFYFANSGYVLHNGILYVNLKKHCKDIRLSKGIYNNVEVRAKVVSLPSVPLGETSHILTTFRIRKTSLTYL